MLAVLHLDDGEPEPAEFLVAGLIPKVGVTLIVGAESAGKSMLLAELSAEVAGGGIWAGRALKAGSVLYISPERGTVSCHGSGGLDREARVIVSLAGRIAERWAHRCVELAFDDELIPWLEMIRCPGGGHCDECRALRGCVVLSEHGPNAEVLRVFRALEQRAVELVQTPPIWRAINALADKLMERGRLSRAQVAAICAQFFP